MINIIIEPNFAHSHWCSQYLKGINSEAKRKNIDVREFKDAHECIRSQNDTDIVILIGTSVPWLDDSAEILRRGAVRSVILSAGIRQDLGKGISYVSMDYDDAMVKTIRYFESIGIKKCALFAVSPESSTDQNKRSAFLGCGRGYTDSDVYYFNATLDDVCRKLYDNVEKYDAVICANQISKIVLKKFLSEQNVDTSSTLRIASFGDTSTNTHTFDNEVLIKIKAIEAGKLASKVIRLLRDHPDLGGICMNVTCDIVTEQGVVDFEHEFKLIERAPSEKIDERELLKQPLMIEKILCNCDKIDLEILKGIHKKENYSKIAARAHISENTIGYRIKRLMQFANTTSKEEMIKALGPYLI